MKGTKKNAECCILFRKKEVETIKGTKKNAECCIPFKKKEKVSGFQNVSPFFKRNLNLLH
jgi:hypothetical protein